MVDTTGEGMNDEDRGTIWGKVASLQQLFNTHGFGLNANTAIALRVLTYLCEVPMDKRGQLDLDMDVLINVALAEQKHIRKEH